MSKFGAILLLFFSCARPLPQPPTERLTSTIDIQGHRGARGLLPENTLPAFAKALELGVTTLELDLQVTRDRILVVAHDPAVNPERCVYENDTAIPENLLYKNLPYSTLSTIDCGRKRHPKFPEQTLIPHTRIPTLVQVLELAKKAKYPVRLNIEIKMEKPELTVPADEFAKLAVETVRQQKMESRVTLQSFYPPALVAAKRLAPEIPTVMLVEERSDYDKLMKASGADMLSPYFKNLEANDIRVWHARKIPVIPWTVNEKEDMTRLLFWGVDGIISDYPDRLIQVVNP